MGGEAMIAGVVNAQCEAIIGLTLIGANDQQIRVEAVIDTGFDGWLILSPSLIDKLGYAWRGSCESILADGSNTDLNVYGGVVLWDRRRRNIPAHEAESTPLLGMRLLEGFELTIQARSGGSVTIRRLPKD